MTHTTERAARSQWAAHYATLSGYRFMPSEELVRFCGRQRHDLGRVLEVGCGNGANLWFLARQSNCAVGVDFHVPVLTAAQELCESYGCGQETRDSKPGRRVWLSPALLAGASAYDLPFTTHAFDTVVDSMVSQHFPWADHRDVYHEYRRVLRPGGKLFLLHLVMGTSGSRYNREDYPEGIALFPDAGFTCLPGAGQLVHELRTVGFSSVEERGMTRSYPDGSTACYAVLEGTR
jgi:SAM-dependent methyltransferase